MSISSQYIRGRRRIYPPMTRSGAAFLTVTGEVDNPAETTIYTVSATSNTDTATESTVYEVSVS